MARRADPATVELIRELARQGCTDAEIATKLNAPRWWIAQVRQRHSIAPGRLVWTREQWRARSVGRFDLEDTDEL